MAAVFGPEAEASARHAGNVCDAKEVPYIETRYRHEPPGQIVSMYPSEATLANVIVDLVQSFEWGSFTIMYETSSLVPRFAELLQMYDAKGHTVTLRQIDLGVTKRNRKNYRAVLRRIEQSEDKRLIIECSIDALPEILSQVRKRITTLTIVH